MQLAEKGKSFDQDEYHSLKSLISKRSSESLKVQNSVQRLYSSMIFPSHLKYNHSLRTASLASRFLPSSTPA